MPYTPNSWESLRSLMERVTTSELDGIVSDLSFELPSSEGPVFFRDKPKVYNIGVIERWAARASPQSVQRLRDKLEAKVREKEQLPVRGPVLGTRQIKWEDFKRLPSFPIIESAITFPYTHTRKASPFTRDGYVSVAAIFNLSAWASWKSSSLGERERRVAEAINQLKLGDLMRLNHGRRTDEPALFPERMLPIR